MFQGFISDFRHAVRIYRRTPLQSLSAVLVIAIAVSFSTAFFSLYSSVALQPVPGVDDSQELVALGFTDGKDFNPGQGPSVPMIEDIMERSQRFDAIAGSFPTGGTIAIPSGEFEATFSAVSPGFFKRLSIPITQGRAFDDSDHDSASRSAILTHSYWQDVFGGDQEILGRVIQIRGTDFRIIGVAGRGFNGFNRTIPTDIFLPQTTLIEHVFGAPSMLADRMGMNAIGRLADGATLSSANSELDQLSEVLAEEYESKLQGTHLEAIAHAAAKPYPLRDAEKALSWFVAASILLVIVSATNLSLFFLARAPGRGPELRVRQSVGATRGRMLRQLATETTLIVMGGTVLGVFAALSLAVILKDLPIFGSVVWQNEALLDWRGAIFSGGLAIVLSVICASGPLWSLRRGPGRQAFRDSGRAGYLQSGITVFQVALAVTVLAVAAVFVLISVKVFIHDLNFNPESVSVIKPRPTENSFSPSTDDVREFRQAVRERMQQNDPESQVAFADSIPMVTEPERQQVQVRKGEVPTIRSRVSEVDPAWFDLIQLGMRDGRTDQLTDSATVAVNAKFAQKAWGRTDVVGESILLSGDRRIPGSSDSKVYTVTAVTDDMVYSHPLRAPEPAVYRGQVSMLGQLDPIYIRSSLNVTAIREILEPTLASASVPLAIGMAIQLDERIQASTASDRARAGLTVAAALLVVSLAVMGFFGGMSLMVSSGGSEFALRSAVGASPAQIQNTVIWRGFQMAGPGVILGSVFGLIAVYLTQGYFQLPGFNPWFAVSLACAVMLILLSVAVALPARRAAKIQPGSVLRED